MKKYTLKKTEPERAPSYTIPYEKELNESQLSAVTFGSGPSLVIAGAGSGKTRTLVYRVARLIESGVPPSAILLLTFTRKAAREMLSRAAALVGGDTEKVAGGTFHSFASSILREYADAVGFSASFTILDRGDGEDIINLVRGRLGLADRERRFPRKETIGEIFSKAVNRAVPVTDVIQQEYPHFAHETEKLLEVLAAYTEYKQAHMLMDYDDLLVHLVRLLEKNEAVREALKKRYRYILVDEYQDTNGLQARIVELLSGEAGNVMAVGDDSQSIYSFRGAHFKNIMDFPTLFPSTAVIKLEENYRSTQSILNLANVIIDRAREKYTKILWTKKGVGTLPALVPLPDEPSQSRFVAQRVLDLREEGVPLSDICVLFRAGFNSFDLEIELKKRNIPFVKHGGFKFMETAHVKDIVAHIKVLVNPRDAVGLKRMLMLVENVGPQTEEQIAASILSAGRVTEGLAPFAGDRRFGEGIGRLSRAMGTLEGREVHPAEAVERLLEYYTPIAKRKYDDHPKRLEDLEHLAIIARKYRSIESFLTDMALEPPSDSISDILREDPDPERLILSTIHSAKGLEWHSVFIIWAAEGYFPTTYAAESDDDIEEELRLMYVAATRAKENLTITYPIRIVTHRGPAFGRPSRFIEDIDEEILETWSVEEEE
jgi:DNA helicase-2/ATP-dependent DNA helicase PcrA